MAKSELEALLLFQIKSAGLPIPKYNYRFHDTQRWRFDFAYPEHMIAIEIEGGIWTQGRHTRGAGFLKDCKKYNTATLMGWAVLRFPSNLVKSGEALQVIEQALKGAV